MNIERALTSPAQTNTRAVPGSTRRLARVGQATVEFAIVSIIFLMLVLGSFDLGRAVYMYSQLTNSVREGARYGQVTPNDQSGIKSRVINYSSGLKLTTSSVTINCSGSCKTGDDITVSAQMSFRLIAQSLLGIKPFTMHAHATDAIE